MALLWLLLTVTKSELCPALWEVVVRKSVVFTILKILFILSSVQILFIIFVAINYRILLKD